MDALMQTSILGVVLQDLPVIPTDGGAVLKMLRSDSSLFKAFGEVYFSEVQPGKVRAWKSHREQTQMFCVPYGRMKLVLYDERPESPTYGRVETVVLGRPHAYRLLRVPPKIWYGFTPLGNTPALLCNCADKPHDPSEALRRDMQDPAIPYHWESAAQKGC